MDFVVITVPVNTSYPECHISASSSSFVEGCLSDIKDRYAFSLFGVIQSTGRFFAFGVSGEKSTEICADLISHAIQGGYKLVEVRPLFDRYGEIKRQQYHFSSQS